MTIEGHPTYHRAGISRQRRELAGAHLENPQPLKQEHAIWSWISELIALLFSIGFLVAIFLVLAKYDGEPLPEWASGINLNTMVAVFATLSRALMLVVVAEVIGQLKWQWFDIPRPLGDLDRLDHASRGVWGSVQLLFLSFRLNLVMVAALVVIVSAAFGPFTQQAIRTTACSMPVSGINSTAPIAHYVGEEDDAMLIRAESKYTLRRSMRSALINALATADDGTSKLPVECSTGTCTFNDAVEVSYASAGICHTCQDVTSFVRQHPVEEVTQAAMETWGPTLVVDGMTDDQNITMRWDIWANIVAQRVDRKRLPEPGRLNVSYLTYTHAPCSINSTDPFASKSRTGEGGNYNWICPKSANPKIPNMLNNAGVLAVNCTFYPCLRQYHSIVNNGMLQETVISDTAMYSPTSPQDDEDNTDPSTLLQPCFLDGQLYDVSNISQVSQLDGRQWRNVSFNGSEVEAPDECIYTLAAPLLHAIFNFLRDNLLAGVCRRDESNTGYSETTFGNRSNVFCENGYWQEELYGSGFATFDSVHALMRNLALAATNRIRITGKGVDRKTPEFAEGTVWETTVCAQVDWRWLALPATVELLTLVLLLAILAYDWRRSRPVWKSSALPLMFHGLRVQSDENYEPVQLRQMKEKADETHVRLVTKEGSSGFLRTGRRVHDKGHQSILNRTARDSDADSLLEAP